MPVIASRSDQTAAGPWSSYWWQSRAPLASLVFITPLLVAYECGVLRLGKLAVRNGADLWLRSLLDCAGFEQYFLLPILAVGILLGWHHVTNQPWRLRPPILCGMFAESLALGTALMLLAQVQGTLFARLDSAGSIPLALPVRNSESVSRIVAFLGAGIYEEVLFRLTLLPLVVLAARWLGASRRTSLLCGIVLTSLVFALAHYLGPTGDTWQWYSFAFRCLAGGYFAVLFVYRGFGIAAGSHAAYDILVGW